MRKFVCALAALLSISLALWATPQKTAPNKQESQAELKKQAKITMEEAQKTALAEQPGVIKGKELEKENGKLVYSFDIQTKSGLHEVQIDAVTGGIVEDTVETPADEAKERQQEKTQRSKSKSSRTTKQ
jgi:uncharacterized membrane protein YkoI